MANVLKCVTPVDGSVYVDRKLATQAAIEASLGRARKAAAEWRHVPIRERQAMLTRAVDAFVASKAKIAEEISWQMGRPVAQSPGEVRGFEERSRTMIELARRRASTASSGATRSAWCSSSRPGTIPI